MKRLVATGNREEDDKKVAEALGIERELTHEEMRQKEIEMGKKPTFGNDLVGGPKEGETLLVLDEEDEGDHKEEPTSQPSKDESFTEAKPAVRGGGLFSRHEESGEKKA